MRFGRFDEQGQTYEIIKKENGDFEATDKAIVPFQLLTPIDFRCIYAIGLNYRAHAQETGMEIPKYPMVFMKASTATQNPGDRCAIVFSEAIRWILKPNWELSLDVHAKMYPLRRLCRMYWDAFMKRHKCS